MNIGVLESEVSRWLSGGKNFNLDLLVKVGYALGVRWFIQPTMIDKANGPAENDPDARWVYRLAKTPRNAIEV